MMLPYHRFEMREPLTFENKFPSKEELKRRAAGGPGPSEKTRQKLRKKRK